MDVVDTSNSISRVDSKPQSYGNQNFYNLTCHTRASFRDEELYVEQVQTLYVTGTKKYACKLNYR